MRWTVSPQIFERVFFGIILLTLGSFAYYFTVADLEEVQTRFANRRVVLVKLLGREVVDLMQRRQDLTPRLANLLAEEAVAYAVVQLPTGEILAKAESVPISVGTLQEAEAAALKSSHLQLRLFVDPSGTVPLVEAALPLLAEVGRKVVLRVGFHRTGEEERLRQVRFRNLLLFSVLMLGFVFSLMVRRRQTPGLPASLMAGGALLLLLLFLSSRLVVQDWYDRHWRQEFVKQGLSMGKIMAPSALRFLQTGEDKAIRDLQSQLEQEDMFSFLAIIKDQDEQFVFHSDPSRRGETFVPDPHYVQSLNSEHPVLFQIGEEDVYELLMPLLEGNNRLGTLRLGFRNASGYEPLSILRNRLILLFIGALVLMLTLVYQLGRRFSKETGWFIKAMEQVTAGDLRQQVFIDRHDEFGQMAHAFNFMLMSLKERDLLGHGLQQYVSKSIVDKTLKVLTAHESPGEKSFAAIITIYLAGLQEVLGRLTGPQALASVREVFLIVSRITPPDDRTFLQFDLGGLRIVFCRNQRHDVLMRATQAAQSLSDALLKRADLPFSPRISIQSLELLQGAVDEDGQVMAMLGESPVDVRAFAQVQDAEEIVVAENTAFLLRDVATFDELEICAGDQGRHKGLIFRGFRPPEELAEAFPSASSWARVLILKLLKGYGGPEQAPLLMAWFADADDKVRYHILDALERLRPAGISEFVVKVLQEEKDARVLSRAIGVMGKIGNDGHIPLLAEQLRSPDRRVKANAIEALEAIGGKKVYEFLNLLVDEQDNRVKANILIAMGKYGDLRVFELLSRMIKDPDKNMRASAAFALGRLGMAQGVEPLISALGDKDLGVRRQVVASLTSLKADLEIET
jgi:hypothetical protein